MIAHYVKFSDMHNILKKKLELKNNMFIIIICIGSL